MPNGCSSGRVSTKLAAAPLLTCMRMSPSDSSERPQHLAADARRDARRCPAPRSARSAPPAAARPRTAARTRPRRAAVGKLLRQRLASSSGPEPQQPARPAPGTSAGCTPTRSRELLGRGPRQVRRAPRPGTGGRRCARPRRSAGCRRRWRCRPGTPCSAGSRASSVGRVASSTRRADVLGVVGRPSRGPARARAASSRPSGSAAGGSTRVPRAVSSRRNSSSQTLAWLPLPTPSSSTCSSSGQRAGARPARPRRRTAPRIISRAAVSVAGVALAAGQRLLVRRGRSPAPTGRGPSSTGR